MALGKRINTLNLKKTSPARGMFDSIWSESGGWFGDKAEKRKATQAEDKMNQAINDFGDLDTSNLAAGLTNPYADAKNVYAGATNSFAGAKNAFAGAQNQFANVQNQFGNLENTAEDLTVNTQQAEFEKQQFQQSQANMLSNLSGAAGGSGVAGLAQALSNQNMRQAQQSSASIGQQESQNQRMAAQQAGSNQMASAQGAQSAEMARAQGAANQQSQIMGGAAQQQSQIMQGAAQQQQMILGGAASQQGMILGGAANLQAMQLQGATDARGLEYEKQQAMVAARSGQYATAEQQRQQGNTFNQYMDYLGTATELLGSAAAVASDRKLKENINLIGKSTSGINIYSFEYKNKKFGDGVYQGVMADEVPQAIIKLDDYNAVDYSKIDVNFKQI
mgnify:FL=1